MYADRGISGTSAKKRPEFLKMIRDAEKGRISSKGKTQQGKYSGKYVLSGLLVCAECGSPYRRVLWMPDGERRYVWRCINRLEHGKRICKHSPTLEEPELQAAVAAVINGMIHRREAKEVLAQCVTTALAGQDEVASLSAVEARLRALQAEQLELLHLAMDAGPDCTEYDERIEQVNAAMAGLLARKGELEQEGRAVPAQDRRVRAITDTLEETSDIGEGFNDALVYQTVSSIKVLDKDRLLIRFKDGTEVEQAIEHIGRKASA